MGTETLISQAPFLFRNNGRVKLNNPQTGTETSHHDEKYRILNSLHVKLNNPQMGTETSLGNYCH